MNIASVPVEKLDQTSLLMLYAINSTESKSVDETHLQKIIFQVTKAIGANPDDLGFRPHLYGPFSETVKEERESLEQIGYLDAKNKRISINESEKAEVSKIRLPENIGFRIKTVTDSLSKLTHDELLLTIYHDDLQEGGRYLENSEVIEEVLSKRVSTAIKMHLEKKATLERSSELAGMSVRDFTDELVTRFGSAYVY